MSCAAAHHKMSEFTRNFAPETFFWCTKYYYKTSSILQDSKKYYSIILKKETRHLFLKEIQNGIL